MNDNVLILIQLNGGSDGLNTVIPYMDDNYYKARGGLAMQNILILKPGTGIHTSMVSMYDLYNNGQLAIIQGVGYDKPNYSHFRSTDILMSGSSSEENKPSGWLDNYLPTVTTEDPGAVGIGKSSNLITQRHGFNFENPERFYDLLNQTMPAFPINATGRALKYIYNLATNTKRYAVEIKDAAGKVKAQQTYPNSSLAAQLKIVAKCIAGGLKTKVYCVTADGSYDTHANQLGQHAWLLQQLSDAIAAFASDCKYLGIWERICGLTFSEFGRRILPNGSGGTDHGSSQVMFCFGGKIKGGLFGENPKIPDNPVVTDNLTFETDFRRVYATAIKHLGGDVVKVLGKNYESLNFV